MHGGQRAQAGSWRGRATVAALGLGLLALAGGALLEALHPRLAVAAATSRPGSGGFQRLADGTYRGRVEARDPWGHRLVSLGPPGAPDCSYYSVGPDGRDDGGGGDDVVPTRGELEAGLRLDAARVGLFSLAALALWCLHGPHVRTPRAPSLLREAWRSLLLATGGALFLPGLVAGFVIGRRDVSEALDTVGHLLPQVVPPLLSVGGTVLLLCWSSALAWRLSRPLRPSGRDHSRPGRRQGVSESGQAPRSSARGPSED